MKDLKAWRDGWDDILRLQYNASEAFANLYKPIEGLGNNANEPSQRHVPEETPQHTMQRCLALQKMYSEMKADLQQELTMITNKVMRPVEESKRCMKSLQKTLKHRENMKLDYERYMSRAEHARKKDAKSMKDEASLAKHENDLQQAQINYNTADDQVKTTFPPVVDAIMSLLPYLLVHQVMIQTTMVGQIYTSLDQYCRSQRLPSPAPSDGEIVSVWDQHFTAFRKELESGLALVAGGKAVHQSMNIPEKDGSTMTGLGIRNKTSSLVHRSKSNQSLPQKPSFSGRSDSAGPGAIHEEEEAPPPKPPRPGMASGAHSPAISPGSGINMSSKPRMPSYGAHTAPYDQKPTNLMPTPSYPSFNPPPYTESDSGTSSRYLTPTNGLSPKPSSYSQGGGDYFGNGQVARRTSAASFASSAANAVAAKKKPPPPVPVKRLPSQQAQFVTALYDFEGQSAGDLAFHEGDRIRVVKKTDSTDDWWDGELNGRRGAFPANYVQL